MLVDFSSVLYEYILLSPWTLSPWTVEGGFTFLIVAEEVLCSLILSLN